MADNKKYYYLKLKESFFEDDNIILLESMPDGYLYSNILLKLYLRSLKNDGRLMLNNTIPYNPQMIASLTRHNVGNVEKALKLFIELGLVEVLDNGAIYMMDIQNFIGESSTEADRKRSYRNRIEREKRNLLPENGQMSAECPDKSPPEIRDRDKSIELEIRDRDIYGAPEADAQPTPPEPDPEPTPKPKSKRFVKPTLEEVAAYCESRGNSVNPQKFFNHYESNGWKVGKNPMKDWKAAVRTWEQSEYGGSRNAQSPQQQKRQPQQHGVDRLLQMLYEEEEKERMRQEVGTDE